MARTPKPYAPKPTDPGQPLAWGTRTGVIWSAGPFPASAWVMPDDAPGELVAVKLSSKSSPARDLGKTGETARTLLAAAERVRHASQLWGDATGGLHVDGTCTAAPPAYRDAGRLLLDRNGSHRELTADRAAPQAAALALLRDERLADGRRPPSCAGCVWGRSTEPLPVWDPYYGRYVNTV